ncbi:MAG: hypothetical protein AAGH99_07395 [Planctomycetota bacterium]
MSQKTGPDETIESARNGPEARDRWFRVDDLKANLGRQTARGGLIVFTSTGINFVVSTVGTVLITRSLTDEDFGYPSEYRTRSKQTRSIGSDAVYLRVSEVA